MLKLLALDEEDLAVFSFHLHQARLCPQEILWQAEKKRFLAPLRRFDWDTALRRAAQAESESAAALRAAEAERAKTQPAAKRPAAAPPAAEGKTPPQELPAILHCDRVLSVRSRGMSRSGRHRPLTLKGLCFKPAAAPAGILEFLFYEQAGLRLELECIEMKLTDLAA